MLPGCPQPAYNTSYFLRAHAVWVFPRIAAQQSFSFEHSHGTCVETTAVPALERGPRTPIVHTTMHTIGTRCVGMIALCSSHGRLRARVAEPGHYTVGMECVSALWQLVSLGGRERVMAYCAYRLVPFCIALQLRAENIDGWLSGHLYMTTKAHSLH